MQGTWQLQEPSSKQQQAAREVTCDARVVALAPLIFIETQWPQANTWPWVAEKNVIKK